MLAAVGILWGVTLGWLSGGRITSLPNVGSTRLLVITVLFGLQGVARGRLVGTQALPFAVPVWGVVSGVICIVVIWGVRRGIADHIQQARGIAIAVLGIGLNMLVVLANEGMPVVESVGSAKAVAASGGFYQILNRGSILPCLGDTLSLNLGSLRFLLSAGDVLLFVGVAILLVEMMQIGVLGGAGLAPSSPRRLR